MKSDITGEPAGGKRDPAGPDALEAAALRHLERYASSTQHLRRLLNARLQRLSARGIAVDLEAGAAAIERVLVRLQDLGLLDDRNYAELRARALRRKGASRRAIQAELHSKGIAADLIAQTLTRESATETDSELAAAIAFARRRGLGPFRREPAQRAARRARDLAAMGRKGFDQQTARRVIDCADPSELEEEAKRG